MAYPKEERNRRFVADWKRGLSDKQLGGKYDLSIGGVKGLKARLRAKDPSLRVSTSTPTSTKRMTFWLPVPIIEKIKKVAAKEKRTASAVLREVLRKHLKNK